ncbi:MAG TPA: Ig-like domain-containing protein, partial [Verrucomicrobiae bacterium]|nr:Ig-like domain-containing protein [Verrucomicrobiae bacterium]
MCDFGWIIFFFCLLVGSPVKASDVVGDFSTNANPNGVWSYGWATVTGNTFQLATTPAEYQSRAAVGWDNGLSLPDLATIDKDYSSPFTLSTVVFYPDTLHLDPQSYAVMARFTAPSNGNYQVNGLFRLQDTGTQAHDLTILLSGTTTNFHVLTSGGSYNSQYPFTFATALNSGQTLDFVVGCHNGSFENLGTGLKATVTNAIGTVYNWTGAASSAWSNPTNWSPQGTPGSLDTAVILSGSPVISTAAIVSSVALGSNGTLNATAGLTVSNLFDWTGGSLTGNLTVAGSATMNLNYPGGNLFMDGATVVNNGTAIWDGGTLYCNSSTIITNNGSWLAETDDVLYNTGGGTPTFYNNGTFSKAPTTGNTSLIGLLLDNSGTVNINSGELTLSAGGSLGGTFLAASNTTVTLSGGGFLNGTFTAARGAQFQLTGGTFTYGPNVDFTTPGASQQTGGAITLTNNTITNVAIAGGTITLSPTFQGGSITNLTMVGATLTGTNTVTGVFNLSGTINGALTVAHGASCFMTNLALTGAITVATNATLNFVTTGSKTLYGSTLVNNGTLAWDGGTIYFNQSTVVTNNGSWLAETDDGIYNGSGNAPVFYNRGIFTKSPTTGTTTFSGLLFDNTGTVNVETGTINLNGGGQFLGSVQVASGAILNISNGGYLDGTNNAATNGQILLSGGAFTYGSGLDFTGPGANILTGGSLTLTNNTIPNLELNGGTVSLGANFQGGTITNFTLTGCTLTGTNLLTGTMHWQSGEITGVFNVASNAVLYLDGYVDVYQYAALTNAGHIVWSGSGNWRLYNDTGLDGSINNLTNAIVDVECNQTLYSPNGNQIGWLDNAGLLRKSLSGSTTTISMSFTNIGTVDVLTGTLDFGSGSFGGQIIAANGTTLNLGNGGLLAGTFTAGAQAVVDLSGGTFTQTDALSFTGPGGYFMTGSTSLTLLNAPIPNLQMESGTIFTGPAFEGGTITDLALNGLNLNTSNLVTGTLTGVGNINAPLVVASNASLTWNGNVNAQITVMPGATLNWEGGTCYYPLYIPSNAVLNFTANSMLMQNWLTNAGTINWTGGNPRVYASLGVYNLAGAIFNIECDQTYVDYYGGEFFSNAGLVRKLPTLNSPTTGTTTFDLVMENTGVVDIQEGAIYFSNEATNSATGIYQCESNASMTFDDGGILAGAYTAAEGGSVDFSGGTFTIVPPLLLNGAGGYEITGGTLTLTNSLITNLAMLGGVINLPSGFQGGSITNVTLNGASLGNSNLVTGALTINGNIDGPLVVASNASLTWNGNVNAQITVMPGATLNWEGGTCYYPLYIPSNAVLNFMANSMLMQNWLTNAGTINWTGGNPRVYASLGVYNLAGATFNIECDQTYVDYYGGEFFSNAGLVRKLLTTGATTFDLVMDNTGVVDVQDGAIYFNNEATNSATGIYQCESNASMTFNDGGILAGAYTAAEGGAVDFNGGTFTIVPPMLLNGAGSYEITGGTLTLTNSLITNLAMLGGVIDLPSGFQGGSITNVTLNGASLGSSNLVTGTLTINGNINGPLVVASNASLTWNGNVNAQITVMPGATLNWAGGTCYYPLYIPSNAVLNLTANQMLMQNWLTNAGTINWTGGNPRVYASLGVYNLAGATFNIECDSTYLDYYGSEYFNNAGLVRKSPTTGTTTFDLVMDNTGVIDTEIGQIYFNNTFNQTGGTWELGIDGAGLNGQMTFSGAAPLAGNLSVHLNNGYILGLSNSFTLLSYASSSGAFASTNLPTDGASWKLAVGASATTLLLTNLDTPQNVTITSPTNNQSFVIPVNIGITATATDPYAAISSIQFYQGTNLLGQATSSPYTFTWNSVQPGTYALSALAIDAAGAVATSAPVNITVYYNHAQTTNYTWTGAVSGDWFTAGNWNPNGIPGVLDNVTLANGGTISLVNNVSINNFTLTSGTLGGTSLLTVTNTALWTGGTVSGSLTMASNSVLTISGNVTVNGSLVNNGTVNWPGGSIGGNAGDTVTNNGLWLSQSGVGVNLGNALFVNNGILRIASSGYTFSIGNQAFVNNGTVDAEIGSINFNNGGTLAGTYSAEVAGAIHFNGGTFTLGVLPAFTGSGAFELTAGTLDVAITVPPVLQLLGGTVVPGPLFQDAGIITNLTLAGSTLYGSNTLAGTMNWTAGSIDGKLVVGSTSVLTMSSGNTKSVSGSTLVNSGHIIWTGGAIQGDANSAVTNNGTWLNEIDAQVIFGQGNSTFVNNGLFQKTNSTGTTYFQNLTFVNNGTVDAESGTIAFDYGGALGGSYNAAEGAEINFAGGAFTLGSLPTLTGSGVIQLTGGSLGAATGLPANLLLSGGTLTLGPTFQNGGEITELTLNGSTLSGSYTVTGTLTCLSGSANGSLTIATNATLNVAGSVLHLGSCALTNNGTVVWSGGAIYGNSATIAINNGLWLASANGYFQNGDCCGNFTFTNNGTFRNTVNTTEFYGVSFNNYGLVDVEGGTLNFNYGGWLGGTFETAQFANLDLSGGSFTAGTPPVVAGSGLSEFAGGTLTLLTDQIPNLALVGGNLALGTNFQNNGAITNLVISGSALTGSNIVSGTLNWAAGSISSGWLTVQTNGLLNFTTTGAKNLLTSVLLNNGTVTWSGGVIQANGGSFITNNGLWQIQTDNTINNNNSGGLPIFANNGTLSKSVTFGTTTVSDVSLLNSGTLDIESGAIDLINSSSYGQTGATLEFGVTTPSLAGQLIVPGTFNIDGTLSLHFLNGYSPIVGDVIQPVFYGSNSGTFANLNLPTLAAGQSWNLEYGAGSVSLGVVTPSTFVTNTLQLSGSVTGPGNQPISNVTVYATLSSSSNLIQNGSFEVPSIGTSAYEFYGLGSTSVPGWTVIGRAGANVALVSLYWEGPAEDGNQFFDPTGNTGGGGITQTFPTVTGTAYDLIFYHGTYSHQGYANCLAVTLGTNFYTFGETSGGAGNLDWQQVVIPFTATSNLTTLTFADNTGINADDNFVDNVQVLQPGSDLDVQAVTDSSGHYQLTVPNSTLVVGVSGLPAAGYNPVLSQSVTMSDANQVVNFSATPATAPQEFTITTVASPAGAGTVTGAGTYASGANVTVNATAITTLLPYSFSSWTENGVFQSGSPSYSFTAIRDRDLVANFVLPIFTITASNNPPSAGTVTGAGAFTYGATNVLAATPSFGYSFSNWTEGANIVGTTPELSTVVFANHSFVANYTAANVTHVVTTATSPPGLATVAGAGTYTNGQTANFSAPLLITNAPELYTFQQFTLSNTLASSSSSFSKTFSTLDPTNLQYVAVYASSSILPLLTNVSANYSTLIPATTNFILRLQFNRSMRTNPQPLVVLTNSAATIQPVVATDGSWSGTVLADDTYTTPPITIAPG